MLGKVGVGQRSNRISLTALGRNTLFGVNYTEGHCIVWKCLHLKIVLGSLYSRFYAGAADHSGASKANSKRRQMANDFVERPQASGPSPIETMQLQLGVTIKGTQGLRSGGARKPDQAHMTRAEFQAFAVRKAATARSVAVISPMGRRRGDTSGGEASQLVQLGSALDRQLRTTGTDKLQI